MVYSTSVEIGCDGFVKDISKLERLLLNAVVETENFSHFLPKDYQSFSSLRNLDVLKCIIVEAEPKGSTCHPSSPLTKFTQCTVNKFLILVQVKRRYFRHIFNTKFNIGFKQPATDVCSMCQMLKETIKLEKDPIKKQALMNKLMLHKRRAKAFFKLLKEEKPNMITLSFDCEKNMALPKLMDQAAYFSRQISFYNFLLKLVAVS